MTLTESLDRRVIEEETVKLHWALNEMRFPAQEDHVREVIRLSNRIGVSHLLMIALVTGESSWNPRAVHYNRGSNDYGLFQLNNLWHNQYRSDINRHIEEGIKHYKWCLDTEHNNERNALGRYNTGQRDNPTGRQYASYILGIKRDIKNKISQWRASRQNVGMTK